MTKTHTELLRMLIAAQVQVIAHVDEDSTNPAPILNQLDFCLNQARRLVKQLSEEENSK